MNRWISLLQNPRKALDPTIEEAGATSATTVLFGISLGGSLLFGGAIGSYVGRLQILLAAVKMPVFFLGTLLLSFSAMHLFALLAVPTLRLRQTWILCLHSTAVTAAGLGAIAPLFAFLALTAPNPSYPTYLFLWLLLVLCIAVSGAVSLRRLREGLRTLGFDGGTVRKIFFAWLLIYGFVGSQMGWLLRPWVGSSYDVDGWFSLTRNLNGNFYEALYDVICTFFDSLGSGLRQ